MQAVILAGGKGTRLHPLTTSVPKPLVPLFDLPVMEHSIKLLARHGIKDILVTVSIHGRRYNRLLRRWLSLGSKHPLLRGRPSRWEPPAA